MTYSPRLGVDQTFREDVARQRNAETWIGAFSGFGANLRQRLDAWFNPVTGLGGTRDRSTGMQIYQFRPLTWPELDAMYHGEDLPAIIVDRLPTDALSAGFEFGSAGVDQAAARWRLADLVLEARIWARLHGVGGILIGVTGAPMDAPLRLRDVSKGSLEYLLPVDREDLTIAETDMDMASPTYLDPLMYRVGNQNVHPSRLILFPGARTSSRQRQRNGGFDLSVLQRPYNVLRDTETTWRSVVNLMGDLSQAVFAIKDLASMITNGQKSVVMDRMEIVDMARNVARAVVIDADSERFEHVGAQNITGVDPLLMRVFTRLAAAADMPLTLLLGVSPAGLNATGESDLAIWYKKCAGERALLEPAIHYLGALLARDAGLPAPAGVEWPKLWELTEGEQADLENKRALTSEILIRNAITDAEEERRILGGEAREAVLATPAVDPALEAEPLETEDDADPEVKPGEVWTDTVDGNRLEVMNVAGGKVYFRDLDSATPGRQWRWTIGTHLERAMPPASPPLPPAV